MFVIIRITQSFLKNINRDEWFIPDWSGNAPWQLRRTGVPVVTATEEISGAVSRRAKRKRDNMTRGRGCRWTAGGLAAFDTVEPAVMSVSCQLHSSTQRVDRKTGFLSVVICQGKDAEIGFLKGPLCLEVFYNWNSIGGILYKSYFEHYQDF